MIRSRKQKPVIVNSRSIKFVTTLIAFSLTQISSIQIAEARSTPVAKPATPSIEKIISTKSSAGRYDLKVYVSVDKGTGKNKVALTRVSSSGKSCYVSAKKKSCILKDATGGKSIKINAQAKNKNGYGVSSVPITYKVGPDNWYRVKANNITTVSQNQFINSVHLSGVDPKTLSSISFEIAPKVGTYAKTISATYSKKYLTDKKYIDLKNKVVNLPVFGLYQEYANEVSIAVKSTNETQNLTKTIVTPKYSDERYLNPEKVQARDPNVSLDFNAMLLKNWRTCNSPVIIDTDGELRWIGNGTFQPNQGSMFVDNSILHGSGSSVIRQNLDGSEEVLKDYSASDGIINSGHHNYDPGKYGILIDVDAKNPIDPSLTDFESLLVEINPTDGSVIKKWDFAQIIANEIGPDHAGDFVRTGIDWFHMNAATYWPAQDTIVVSSRENFVIGIDYETSEIKWILGDQTKYWHTFPELASHALTLADGSHAPIGQHAVSITSDGKLMLFDNGLASLNQPADAPNGASRGYSAPRQYSIDLSTMTATETWSFENNQSIYSAICSSIYQFGQSYLIDYASEAFPATTKLRLIGLDESSNRAFEYRFPGTWIDGWNSQPINLNNLVFD